MDGAAVLEMTAVGKDFDDRRVLDRVDLTVGAGSIHGLVGPNGAGKTTLLSVLFGLVRADSGAMRQFGRSR